MNRIAAFFSGLAARFNNAAVAIEAKAHEKHLVETIVADFHKVVDRLETSAKHFESVAVEHLVTIEQATQAKARAELEAIKASSTAQRIRKLLG